MKIAILGAGFTGLTAALRLQQQGHQVTIIEKEPQVGGLAGGFKKASWDWVLEKSYHHWFINDKAALNLAKELNYPVIIKRPQTNIFINQQILPIDSPTALLTFPFLPLIDKVRAALFLAYLKLTNNYQSLEGKKALPWIRRYMGQKTTDILWDPLFTGKFKDHKENIALTWFWGRIKKRTPTLAYPERGFQEFAQKLAQKIKNLGGKIILNSEVKELQYKLKSVRVITTNGAQLFDKVICTLPAPVFAQIAPQLPKSYAQKISSIPHLSALNLVLILKKPFLDGTYWLNINDSSFPFLLLAEHTNFIDSKHYGGNHILYIGNYLPCDHPYLQMSTKELLKIFKPYLKKINPSYQLEDISCQLFSQPFAQPIVDINYLQKIPDFKTPLKNVYLANMDMVYPWDRGTNYAIEMGEKIAKIVDNES